MNAQWFYKQANNNLGPLAQEELQRRLAVGELPPEVLVWHEGLSTWMPAKDCPLLQCLVIPKAPEPPVPPAIPIVQATPEPLKECVELPPTISPGPGIPKSPDQSGALSQPALPAGQGHYRKVAVCWIVVMGFLGLWGTSLLYWLGAFALAGITIAIYKWILKRPKPGYDALIYGAVLLAIWFTLGVVSSLDSGDSNPRHFMKFGMQCVLNVLLGIRLFMSRPGVIGGAREFSPQTGVAMYRIIGADGLQYGPITTEQLQQWIAQGRANATSSVQVDGSNEWKPLSTFPGFAS
jgi:hypothetical protein